jgi:hypothetical protein
MLINEVFDKKLKKPLEVKIKHYYIVTNDNLDLYGKGDTEVEAIKDFKLALMDIYETLIIDKPYIKNLRSCKKLYKKWEVYFDFK